MSETRETGIEALLRLRRSTRGYLPDAVPRADVERILQAARRAPSGANLQPGRFHALSGAPLEALRRELVAASQAGREIVSEYSYFPLQMGEALKAKYGASLIDQPESVWLADVREFGTEMMMAMIREDLAALGVTMDVFSSEKALGSLAENYVGLPF